jgi:hypothetical protein
MLKYVCTSQFTTDRPGRLQAVTPDVASNVPVLCRPSQLAAVSRGVSSTPWLMPSAVVVVG